MLLLISTLRALQVLLLTFNYSVVLLLQHKLYCQPAHLGNHTLHLLRQFIGLLHHVHLDALFVCGKHLHYACQWRLVIFFV